MLGKNKLGERRGKWVSKLKEFNMEIEPSKIIQGQGLENMIAKVDPRLTVFQVDQPQGSGIEWYAHIRHFLTYGTCPTEWN